MAANKSVPAPIQSANNSGAESRTWKAPGPVANSWGPVKMAATARNSSGPAYRPFAAPNMKALNKLARLNERALYNQVLTAVRESYNSVRERSEAPRLRSSSAADNSERWRSG